jgi:hypothetical protein
MVSTHDRYLDGMREEYRLLVTWPPTASVELGDVGRLEGGCFERLRGGRRRLRG